MTEEMREIDGVEVSVSTIKSALEKAGIKLEKKVDWRKLNNGTVVECGSKEQAFVYYNSKERRKELCLINSIWTSDPKTAYGVEGCFNNCKVIGKIKFSVEKD